jgi:hypothetical protein
LIASFRFPGPCPCKLRTCSLGRLSAALQGGIYAASSAAEGAQTLLGVDATVAVAVRTPPREPEARVESTRAEAEVASKAAASSQAGAAMLGAAGEQTRTAATELAARIAEVEAEAVRRLAVSTKACVRPETRDYSVPCLTGIVEAMSYGLQALRRSTCEDRIRHALLLHILWHCRLTMPRPCTSPARRDLWSVCGRCWTVARRSTRLRWVVQV